ncbi:MAG: phosphosulfolactate synthase, partial [Desulfobacteraceae bacterium]|nr:phosphosulfolactate synthase [Desulfobacteraceae bacterium]
CIRMDLDAGAAGVMIETRKSGRGGVCNKSGQPRPEVLDAIVHDGIPLDRVIFEAPNRLLQTTYIRRFGANVNLANIAFADIVGVESLRLGLRADTLDR